MISPEAREICERFGDHVPELAASWFEEPTTLVHGEFRPGHLFFGDRNSRRTVCAIDWQLIGRRTAASDVAYFLQSTLQGAAPRADQERLLRVYHSALVDRGVHGYSFDNLVEAYRGALFREVWVFVGAIRHAANARDDRDILIKKALNRFQALIDWQHVDLIPKQLRD